MKSYLRMQLVLCFLLFPITQAMSTAPDQHNVIWFGEREASTFSLLTYCPDSCPIDPPPPLPENWKEFVDIPFELNTNGYYAKSYISCEPGSKSNDYTMCSIVIAHRGTTNWTDSWADMQIFFGTVPTTYAIAKQYSAYVHKYFEDHFDQRTTIGEFYHTGHSLGAILAELTWAYDDGQKWHGLNGKAIVFDSPGSKKMVQSLIEQKTLPANSLERMKNRIDYYFSGPNIINTCNQQVYPEILIIPKEFGPEDFSKTKIPSDIGSPGKLYFYSKYSLHQHEILNFYNEGRMNFVPKPKPVFSRNDDNFTWPVGEDESYAYYASYKDGSFIYAPRRTYWDRYMHYMWVTRPDLQEQYKNIESWFDDDFIAKLKKGERTLEATEKVAVALNSGHNQGDEILEARKPVKPNTANKRQTLYDVINGNLDGHSDIRRQLYAVADDNTRLYYAVICGDVTYANNLLQHTKVDVNTQHGERKYSLLQIATMQGFTDMVDWLLRHGANPELADTSGNNVLHTAVLERHGDVEVYAKMLIKFGANPNATNHAGETPLMILEKHHPQKAKEFNSVLTSVF